MDTETYNRLRMVQKKQKQELYVSTDIEANGRVPGLSSMLSFASAVFDIDKNLLGTFSRNLNLLPGSNPHPETDAFWNETDANKAAYLATRVDTVDPAEAMRDYAAFLKGLPGTPVFVGYPAAFDFKWIDYYAHAFIGDNPFGFSRCIDVKSYAYAVLKKEKFSHTTKRNMPKNWFDDLPHTHIALDDAIEQGAMWINLLRETTGLPRLANLTLAA
ncbi:hypothetical protein D3C71_1181750 [compost metagenome]